MMSESAPIREQPWLRNLGRTQGAAKSDYAANSGDSRWISDLYQPPNYAGIRDDLWPQTDVCQATGSIKVDQYLQYCQTGIMYYRSTLKIARISDGTSNTYLVGEKWMPVVAYDCACLNTTDPGFTYGDNNSIYAGYESDNHRGAWDLDSTNTSLQEFFQPMQDRDGVGPIAGEFAERRFGSAHPGSFHMAFCDGSVQSVSYDIDPITHSRLANRFDGEVAQLPSN
jgi:prepilin-type processing-associated H-X9-DG protein